MAGSIPREFIDDLIRRIDIVEVVEGYVPLRKAGHNYTGLCPFHTEKTPSFTVSPEKQFYHCFGCGAHGTAIGFLMELEGMTFPEAVRDLASRAGIEVPSSNSSSTSARPAETESNEDLLAILEEAARYFRRQLREHSSAREAVDYLKARGLTGDIAQRFGLGYAPAGWDNLLRALGNATDKQQRMVSAGLLVRKEEDGRCYDRFRHRIIFPIRDRRGRVIGFGGRVLGDDTPKYLNSPESPVFHKGSELYGLYEAKQVQRHLDRLLVVEGYMDVIALAQFGFSAAVATLGTAITPNHVEKLFRNVSEIVFCFDGDHAGRTAAWRALEHTLPAMREGRQARFLFLPETDDPDSLIRREGAEAFGTRLDAAMPLSTFLLDKLSGETQLNTVDGRARLTELAKPLVSKLTDGVFKHMLVEEIAKRAQLETSTLAHLWGLTMPKAIRASYGRVRGKTSTQTEGRKLISPMRKALAILVQHPQLAAVVPPHTWLEQSPQRGARLLKDLLDFLTLRPDVTTGAILEHWRGTDEEAHLAKLVTWPLTLSVTHMESELLGTIHILQTEANARRVDDLLSRRLEDLSAEERRELVQGLLGAGRRSQT